MNRLTNKVAVVTGGNSGIGLASALAFQAEGAQVVISGRNPETLSQAAHALGGKALAVQADVSRLPELDKLVQATVARHPKVDVLFLNAGIALFAPLEAVTEDFYDQHFNTNVKALIFGIQKFLPYLNPGASVILNASIVMHKGFPMSSVYTATKGAVRTLAKTLSAELAERQIRVNVISPGPIDTPIYDRMGMPAEQVAGMKGGFASQVPAGRMGTAAEVAHAAVYLASDESRYLVGTEIRVDGGLSEV